LKFFPNFRRGTLADPTTLGREKALQDMHANCFLLVPFFAYVVKKLIQCLSNKNNTKFTQNLKLFSSTFTIIQVPLMPLCVADRRNTAGMTMGMGSGSSRRETNFVVGNNKNNSPHQLSPLLREPV
jgi:hypothetical protein